MLRAGLEPARVLPHTHLKRARLPIPPPQQNCKTSYFFWYTQWESWCYSVSVLECYGGYW